MNTRGEQQVEDNNSNHCKEFKNNIECINETDQIKQQTNSNMTSSGESMIRDGYTTPRSIHNLNILFNQTNHSNGKKKNFNNMLFIIYLV